MVDVVRLLLLRLLFIDLVPLLSTITTAMFHFHVTTMTFAMPPFSCSAIIRVSLHGRCPEDARACARSLTNSLDHSPDQRKRVELRGDESWADRAVP